MTSVFLKKSMMSLAAVIILVGGFICIVAPDVQAAERLRLACSTQVYEALSDETLDMFMEQTGVVVTTEIGSSESSIKKVMDGQADIATSAQRLTSEQKAAGLVEMMIARDAIIIIANPYNSMKNLTLDEVRDIFSGKTTNAGQVGGRDVDFTVIVPDRETALYNNFAALFMGGREISHAISTTQSTYVNSLTRRIKGGISFVNQAATSPQYGRPVATKIVTVDGLGPENENYPYRTLYSLVAKGEPAGAVKQFADFLFSDDFKKVIQSRNMTACPCPE